MKITGAFRSSGSCFTRLEFQIHNLVAVAHLAGIFIRRMNGGRNQLSIFPFDVHGEMCRARRPSHCCPWATPPEAGREQLGSRGRAGLFRFAGAFRRCPDAPPKVAVNLKRRMRVRHVGISARRAQQKFQNAERRDRRHVAAPKGLMRQAVWPSRWPGPPRGLQGFFHGGGKFRRGVKINLVARIQPVESARRGGDANPSIADLGPSAIPEAGRTNRSAMARAGHLAASTLSRNFLSVSRICEALMQLENKSRNSSRSIVGPAVMLVPFAAGFLFSGESEGLVTSQ